MPELGDLLPPCVSKNAMSLDNSYTLPDAATVVLYLNGPSTTNLPIGAAATNGGNGSVSGTIPANLLSGYYTVLIINSLSFCVSI